MILFYIVCNLNLLLTLAYPFLWFFSSFSSFFAHLVIRPSTLDVVLVVVLILLLFLSFVRMVPMSYVVLYQEKLTSSTTVYLSHQ